MDSEADIGWGGKLEVEDAAGSGVFVELAEIKTLSPPNEQQEQLDVTHMQSPNRTRERIPGLIDPGDMQVTMNWKPGSTTDELIVQWKAARERRSTRITTPDTNNDAITFTFPSFPTSYETPMEADGVMVATLTLQVAGAVVRGLA